MTVPLKVSVSAIGQPRKMDFTRAKNNANDLIPLHVQLIY